MSVESSGARVARDLMTSPVISARPDMKVRELARLMLSHKLGALPVVDEAGAPIGIVSDGDLFGRRPDDKRRVWWLGILERGGVSFDLPERDLTRTARELMTSPVVTVTPATPLSLVAEMLQVQNLKRLPVIEFDRLVGIVSRADLLGSMAAQPKDGAERGAGEKILEFLESLVGGASLRGLGIGSGGSAAASVLDRPAFHASESFTAPSLRGKMLAFVDEKQSLRDAERFAAERDRQRRAKALLDVHVSAKLWQSLLEHAEVAAANGERELLMLRFPCALCSDGGRMIDVAEPGWEATLRGEPAELFTRWRQELQPKGFHISARVDSYDGDGVMAEIGLYLTWGA